VKAKDLIKYVISFLTLSLASTNIIAVYQFCKWIKVIEFYGAGDFNFETYLAVQAHQNSMLQTYLFVVSVVLAVFGFFGYHQLREDAKKIAQDIAMSETKKIAEKYIDDRKKQLNLGEGSYT
jgi:hypothetical protein